MADRSDASGRGVQPERTALAWERTGSAGIVGGALYLRALGSAPRALWLPGAMMILLGTYQMHAAVRKYQCHRGRPSPASPRLMWVVALAAVTFSLACLIAVLWVDGP